MKKPSNLKTLADQQNALTMYLEALLNEVSVEDQENEDDIPATEVHATASQPLAGAPRMHSDAVSAIEPMQTAASISSAAPVVSFENPAAESEAAWDDQTAMGVAHSADSEINKEHEAPAWAFPRFQVLTFSLSNISMAAPLDRLNGIIPFPERLTVLPGQSNWFLGLARNRNQNVQVIDLASAIQPHHRLNGGEKSPDTSQYILLIDDGRWGILCNSISTVLTLEPEQVQWQRSPHVDFILGTVIDKMHSILCPDTLINRLNIGQLV